MVLPSYNLPNLSNQPNSRSSSTNSLQADTERENSKPVVPMQPRRASSKQLDDWKKIKPPIPVQPTTIQVAANAAHIQQHILNPQVSSTKRSSVAPGPPGGPPSTSEDYPLSTHMKRTEHMSSNAILREIALSRRQADPQRAPQYSAATNHFLQPQYQRKPAPPSVTNPNPPPSSIPPPTNNGSNNNSNNGNRAGSAGRNRRSSGGAGTSAAFNSGSSSSRQASDWDDNTNANNIPLGKFRPSPSPPRDNGRDGQVPLPFTRPDAYPPMDRSRAGDYNIKKGGGGASASNAVGNTREEDISQANQRVEKRFQYWKQFWSNIQQLRARNPGASIPLPDLDPSSAGSLYPPSSAMPSAPAGFGLDLGAFQMDGKEEDMELELEMLAAEASERLERQHIHASNISAMQKAHDRFQAFAAKYGEAAGGNSASNAAPAAVPSVPITSPLKAMLDQAAQAQTQQHQQQAQQSPYKAPAAFFPSQAHGSPKATGHQQSHPPSQAPSQAQAQPSGSEDDDGDDDDKNKVSNVERFWQEELARKGKPRLHNQKKKKATHFQAPPDPEAAKAMWEKMKADLDNKWSRYAPGEAGEKERLEMEREGGRERTKPPPPQPGAGVGVSNATNANANANTGWHPHHQPAAAAAGQAQPSSPLRAHNADVHARPQSSDKRSSGTSYAYTNLPKDDLRGSNLRYHPPAPAPSPLHVPSAGYFNVKNAQQPAHPTAAAPTPTVPPSAAAAAAASAQFSSFTRPPQPHHAAPTSNPAPSGPPPSAAGVTNPVQLREIYTRWNVRELKKELSYYGVGAGDIERLVEKEEYVVKMVQVHVDVERKKEARRLADIKEKETEVMRDKIIQEVERWARGRNIKSMLNELNGLQTPEQAGFLKRTDAFKEVNKSYKKALLRIHPDKHTDNESKYLRATEVFKYVSQAFNEFKKKYER